VFSAHSAALDGDLLQAAAAGGNGSGISLCNDYRLKTPFMHLNDRQGKTAYLLSPDSAAEL
jgi:hypothetical protein